MSKFTAGRFIAEVYAGARNGETTYLVETHSNGSDEEVGRLRLRKEDLLDLAHVLRRAMEAHGVKP